jgi:hypothetical protein
MQRFGAATQHQSLTGRGDYEQRRIKQSSLKNARAALGSNDVLGTVKHLSRHVFHICFHFFNEGS